jgi:hypothetical protein
MEMIVYLQGLREPLGHLGFKGRAVITLETFREAELGNDFSD